MRLTLNSFCWLLLLVPVALIGCGGGDNPAPTTNVTGAATGSTSGAASDSAADSVPEPVEVTAQAPSTDSPARTNLMLQPEVVIKTSLGEIRVKLNAEAAPQTVDNFLENYVDRGFYAKTVFHHVDPQFMIAGGGYNDQYEAKPTRTPVLNEADNGLSNTRGTIAMARLPEFVNSATSQFFINVVDNPDLDHQDNTDGETSGYCVFGRVVEGMDVVDRIAKSPTSPRADHPAAPTQPVVIEAIHRVR